MNVEASLQRRWYGKPGWLIALLPLAVLYRMIVAARRCAYRRGWLAVWRAPVPVLVVGNLAVGGTGKTPVTIALCQALRRAGFTPGIISRGYGAQPPAFPYLVTTSSPVRESGDEPLLLAQRTGCAVVIAPQRVAAAQYLLRQQACDIIVCDDGLQHYALARDIEWVVIDGARGLGNGHCLPVGPLRETASRLREVDALLINDTSKNTAALTGRLYLDETPFPTRYHFHLRPNVIVHLASQREFDVAQWFSEHRQLHAVAGIGNPQRFFNSVRELGGEPIEHAFADHHPFTAADIDFHDQLPVLMTEKDAMKCRALPLTNLWFLSVEVELPDSLLAQITGKLRAS